jgi:hypothetical protein
LPAAAAAVATTATAAAAAAPPSVLSLVEVRTLTGRKHQVGWHRVCLDVCGGEVCVCHNNVDLVK